MAAPTFYIHGERQSVAMGYLRESAVTPLVEQIRAQPGTRRAELFSIALGDGLAALPFDAVEAITPQNRAAVVTALGLTPRATVVDFGLASRRDPDPANFLGVDEVQARLMGAGLAADEAERIAEAQIILAECVARVLDTPL